MYGTRDAGSIWEETYADCLAQIGFKRGFASPCCFHGPTLDVAVVVHGVDFTALGVKSNLDRYENEFKNNKDLWKICPGRGGLTASDRRIYTATWLAAAWKMLREKTDFLRQASVSTGFLIRKDRSENGLIKVQGIEKYIDFTTVEDHS